MKPHRKLEFDIQDVDHDPAVVKERGADFRPIDPDDDYDFKVSDDDDFDIP